MESDSWVEQYQREAAERLGQAQEIKGELANATGSAASARGEVRLTVGPGGNLIDIEFGEKATHLAATELAKLVLRTAKQAHHQAGQAMMEIMRPMIGDSGAMDFLKTQLPPEPSEEEPNSFTQRPSRDSAQGDDPDDEGFQGFRR
jgi:DNA-binding protein YbaB